MSNAQVNDAVAKLSKLSGDRAERVLSLIYDLAELEALESTADLAAARLALAEVDKPLPWSEVKKKLDAQFDLSQPAR